MTDAVCDNKPKKCYGRVNADFNTYLMVCGILICYLPLFSTEFYKLAVNKVQCMKVHVATFCGCWTMHTVDFSSFVVKLYEL